MADITKDTTRVGMDAATGMYSGQISGKLAGEAIAKGDACCIKSDGKVWKADASAADELARFVGLAPDAAAVNEAVSVYSAPSVWDYAAGTLTPGAPIYLSATAGALADAAGTGHPTPVAQAIDAYRIRLVVHI
jgi:hypothetical protein